MMCNCGGPEQSSCVAFLSSLHLPSSPLSCRQVVDLSKSCGRRLVIKGVFDVVVYSVCR